MNRSGLEYSSPEPPGSLAKSGITLSELDAIAEWGANLIRLPLNQAWALTKETNNAAYYLAAIDFVVEQAAERGMYTLLDLQWLDAVQVRGTLSNGEPNFVAPLPNAASLKLWRLLARRYQGRGEVLFDIFNEPHDALPDDVIGLERIADDARLFPLSSRRVRMKEWQPWAVQLVRVIREENPGALVFVSGIEWGYDLRGFPLPLEENIVYSSHVYPGKSKSWRKAFGHLAQKAPVFIGELGGGDGDLKWGTELLQYLDDLELGWAAWSWSDRPHLIQPSTPFEPTLFGALIRDSLRQA